MIVFSETQRKWNKGMPIINDEGGKGMVSTEFGGKMTLKISVHC